MTGNSKNNCLNNTIDCIFDLNGTHTVLIRRGREPFKGYWALPGGRQYEQEDLVDTVVREMGEEVGVDIKIISPGIPTPVIVTGQKTCLDQIRTYMSGTDPRGGNTTVHAIQLKGDMDVLCSYFTAGDDAVDLKIVRHDELPALAFDHAQFIEDYFMRLKRYRNPLPTTDVVIEYNDGNKEGIVLITRKNPPRGLALPGGYAEWGISLEENAVKEAKEETGLDVVLDSHEMPLCLHSDPSRDMRKHTISSTFIAKGQGTLIAGDDAADAKLYTIDEVMDLVENNGLVFDHGRILRKYLKHRGYLKDE
ncbi:MAG: NUDIX domain-containing protein [Candidatus Woesearchaeota archaeon]